MRNRKATTADFLIAGFLFLLILAVIVPFINTIAISFSTQREYLNTPLLLIPREPTLNNYINLLGDERISIGYLTSLKILLLGLPINLFLTVSLAYGTSRKSYPGKRLILGAILFTMLFNGGILPLYLQMRELHLTNTIWSVVLASGINVFYFVLARNYFCSLPEALIESAQLDGAGEWRILFSIILPISKPILATITLFYMVDRWNEWYNALIFIHDNSIMYVPLFAALAAQYTAAGADAPHLMALDEAFAGVDETNIESMFALVQQLGFDYIMNSQALWGCYAAVPALNIAELYRPQNAQIVTVLRYHWDGHIRTLEES